MIQRWLIFLFGLLPALAPAQSWKSKPFSVSVFNSATLLPPRSVAAVFNQPLHPGCAFGYEFGWKETIKDPKFQKVNTFDMGGREVYTGKWFQNVSLGWFYHRYVDHALVITTEAGYRKYLRKFSLEASLHAGYMHAFQLTDRAVRMPDGTWNYKKGGGRPQFVAGAGIGAGYDAGYHYNIRRIFIKYDFRMRMPFVKSYVTLLPYGILSVGIQFTLFRNTEARNLHPSKERLPCPGS